MVNRENPDFLSASTIKGDKVVNRAGEDIGKIEELMIDLDDGRVGYAVLSFGGFLGMGDKLFAIPWKALQLKLHDHKFLLDVPKETLENAEGFDKDNWPITNREWLSTVYGYYGYQPYWKTDVTEETGVAGKHERERVARTERASSRENPDFLSVDTIKGDKVVNRSGDDVGKIDELMIDLESGRVAYVVVSHGGFLGIRNKLFAIPWQALQLRVHEHKFLLDVPKETLDREEGFDKDNWPLHRETLSKTYSNYGYQPYWQTAEVKQPEVSTGKMEQPVVSGGVVRETGTREIETRKVVQTETTRAGVVETDEEIRARQERERLEELRSTHEDKLSQLEKERREREKQAQAEKDKLAQLERDRIEVERQAEAERQKLAQLERELQEARRQEETERVTRLEAELKEVHTQEETRRERLAQLERERTEVEKQAEAERERLAQLERERTEAERRAQEERERLTQMERERTEVETRVETKPGMPDFLSATTIKSDRVVNTAGEDLGRIEELMIDLDNGRVAYAVLSFGGFMGMSDKLFAIPWNSLKCNVHEHAFTLDIPKDVLKNAEGFDKDNWPLTREELNRTYTYYGYQPYWQREAAEITGMPGGTGIPPRGAESERMESAEKRHGRLKTAEEKMAEQDKERFAEMEKTETDQDKKERLERERVIAERREQKYQ